MKSISLVCLAVAILNSILIALDSGQFYQEQLYNSSFSFLQLGFVTALLIELMIGLLFALAFSSTKKSTKYSLLFLGSTILVLSFISSSARHVLPKMNAIMEIRTNNKVTDVLDAEIKRGQNTGEWLRKKSQKLNAIMNERRQTELFEDYLFNIKNQESSLVPTIITVLIIALKFLMQLTAAVFFAMTGHYAKFESLLTSLVKSKDKISQDDTDTVVSVENVIKDEEFDLKALKKKANLNNRSIAEALDLKECVVSNAMNKSGEIFRFLKGEVDNPTKEKPFA